MASFEREKWLVEDLLRRLPLGPASITDPNTVGAETGMDVAAVLADGRTIGIQVTEIDPHSEPGRARAREKRTSGNDRAVVYGGWAQNDPQVILAALARTIERKVAIAAKHSFKGVNEVWLLVCAGIPELGAVISTFVMTPWLLPENISAETDGVLRESKYATCFFVPIVGAEQAVYQWERTGGWTKSVRPEDVGDGPCQEYVESLHRALATRDRAEFDRLFDEECRKVLSGLRAR